MRILSEWAIGRAPKICVIGAGVTGLRCTEILLKHGVDVTVLEARSRVGGRVNQTTIAGNLIDLGPNWIHGTNNNPILDLAKETHSITCSIGEASAIIDQTGNRLDDQKARELTEVMWGIIADAFKYSHEADDISPNRSLKDFFEESLAVKDMSEIDKVLSLQLAETWGAFIGDAWERQSLRYFWLEECIEGENLFLSGTYKAIKDHIARPAMEKAKICLSTTVSAIDTTSFSRDAPRVWVSEESAPTQKMAFDAVVLTAPLGSLKRNEPLISPSMPTRIQHAIENISYGRLEKAFVTFATAWWDESKTSSEAPGAEPSPHSNFTQFLQPEYAKLNPHGHNINCLALSNLPGGVVQPTLLFYVHGPLATEMTAMLASDDPTSGRYQGLLNDFLLPYYSLLPNYAAHADECKPLQLLATEWQRDRFAGYGSYTNFQIPGTPKENCHTVGEKLKPWSNGADNVIPKLGTTAPIGDGASLEKAKDFPHLDEDIKILREGLPHQGLWLAGEHTAPFVALGTVTGAFWSGEAVANRVVDWFTGKDKKGRPDIADDGEANTTSTVQVGKGGIEGITHMEP